MKKILITGGTGFIGNHLCRKLLNEGNEVFCLDNLFTSGRENILDMINHPKFTFILHDINIPFWGQFNQIYNLACPASPIHYQKNPVETIKTSVLGSINMLELALKTKATILQASTSEVYGDPLMSSQNEDYWGNVNPIGIRSCYDEGKRCAESLFVNYYKEYGVDIRIVRIFNTYGPNMHPNDGRVVSNFIMQALKNEDITVYGDGTQSRSFQYIDDLLDGVIKMMNNKNGFTGPVNIGSGFEFSVKDLAELILKLIPESKSKIIYKPLPGDDPHQRKADNSLAFQKLGWKPKVKLEDGLLKTIKYFIKLNKLG